MNAPHPLQPAYDLAPFAARRARLAQRLRNAGGGVAVLSTAPERRRNRDTEYPYRHDSYFYYLTGFREPGATLVLIAGDGQDAAARSILFCRPRDEEREIWDGYRFGPEGARELFGFDEAFSNDQLAAKLPDLLADQPALWYALGYDACNDAQIFETLNVLRNRTRTGVRVPADIRDIRVQLDEMRLFKDESEVEIMRHAARISTEAHRRAMLATRPGRFEYEIEAELLHAFRAAGSQYPAYTSIVAGGSNACVLHYVSNESVLRDGDLLLIDAGCELDGYASDITRCFPVNGRFTGPQRDVYQLVLDAQYAALAVAQPGQTYNATHDAAVRVLAQGMLDLGLLKGSLDEVLETGSFRRFYMHRTGHWLGMDVHDCGEYKLNGDWRPLAPGMMLTIEPGCYMRPGEDVPEAFWNIGVRIEDDVLITSYGHEIITTDAPKSIADIEALMAQAHA